MRLADEIELNKLSKQGIQAKREIQAGFGQSMMSHISDLHSGIQHLSNMASGFQKAAGAGMGLSDSPDPSQSWLRAEGEPFKYCPNKKSCGNDGEFSMGKKTCPTCGTKLKVKN